MYEVKIRKGTGSWVWEVFVNGQRCTYGTASSKEEAQTQSQRSVAELKATTEQDDPTCPYCETVCVGMPTQHERRYVNGLKPKNKKARGCEFCNPLPS